MDLIWNVYHHNFNLDTIELINIFNHAGFRREVNNALKEISDKERFSEELRSLLMYYYWSKCEYEIVISAFVGSRNNVSKKIDIYSQVMSNWSVFLDYVWNHKDVHTL